MNRGERGSTNRSDQKHKVGYLKSEADPACCQPCEWEQRGKTARHIEVDAANGRTDYMR